MAVSPWRHKRVLITGCKGFLGAWMARRLLDGDAEVVSYDLEDGPGTLALHGVQDDVTQVCGNILDADHLQEVLIRHSIETVLHLAGQSNVARSAAHPFAAFSANVSGTVSVLQASASCPSLAGVVVASSNHVYGHQQVLPTTEDAPLNASDVYGSSKACADVAARSIGRALGLPVVVVRNTNTYGEADPHESHIVTSSILSALRGEPPIIRSDGSPTKGYLYVEDTVDAYLALLARVTEPGVRGEAFNVSSERAISVLELVRCVLDAAGRPDLEPTVLGENQTREHEHLSSAKITAATGWTPRHDLSAGLRRTAAWFSRLPVAAR